MWKKKIGTNSLKYMIGPTKTVLVYGIHALYIYLSLCVKL